MDDGEKDTKHGWGAWGAFLSDKDTHGDSNRSFSVFTIFFVLLALIGIGYYTYHQVKGATYVGHVATNPDIDVESGLVAHWTFDGPDITDKVYDQAGNYHGYFTGGATSSAKTTGIIGQSMVFDGVDDRVTIPDLPTGTTFTIVAWIRPEGQIANWGQIIGRNEDNCFEYQKGGKLLMNFSGGWNNSNTSMTDNEWHLVAMVVSSGNGTYYLDGRPDGTKTGIGSANYTGIGSNGAEPFKGRIDDLRFYNRALSDAEMKALYAMTKKTVINSTVDTNSSLESGLVGHFTFDGPQMDWASTTGEVKNSVSGGVRGNVTNFTSSAATLGKIGQGLRFDGVDDFVSVGSSSFFEPSSISLSFWIKANSVPPANYVTGIVYLDDVFVNKRGWGVKLYSDGNMYWQTGNGTNHSSAITPFTVGSWDHYVTLFEGGNLIIYKNGVLATTSTMLGSVSYNTGNPVYIGKSLPGLSTSFDGGIDDVRIYNRALSVDEVAELYALGGGSIVGKCGSGPVLDSDGNKYGIVQIGDQCWLDRNMNVGTRINRATGQSNDGVIQKYCHGDTDSNCTDNHPKFPDGGLYEWNEAMQYSTTPGSQGICPSGWHIPTHNEFTTLERAVCRSSTCATDFPYDTTTTGTRGTTEGEKLKTAGSSGFGGTLAGQENAIGFANRNGFGYFWTSSEGGSNAWNRIIASSNSGVGRTTSMSKAFGISVRCIKD